MHRVVGSLMESRAGRLQYFARFSPYAAGSLLQAQQYCNPLQSALPKNGFIPDYLIDPSAFFHNTNVVQTLLIMTS